MTYIPSAPGDDFDADAWNILQAGLADNWEFVKDIMNHQVDPLAAEAILADVLAWLVIVLKGLPRDYSDHILGHLRDMVISESCAHAMAQVHR